MVLMHGLKKEIGERESLIAQKDSSKFSRILPKVVWESNPLTCLSRPVLWQTQPDPSKCERFDLPTGPEPVMRVEKRANSNTATTFGDQKNDLVQVFNLVFFNFQVRKVRITCDGNPSITPKIFGKNIKNRNNVIPG